MSTEPRIEYRCNECQDEFEDLVDDEFCPTCGGSSIFEREVDDLDDLEETIEAEWPEIPVLQPIAVRPVELSAPEFKRRG